jgi:hypothetical protein
VDTKKEIREFLTSRRARITPEQAGLRSYGSRRVPGLRREEVAVLAGVSVPYYIRLERGDMSGVSESVLDALTRGSSSTTPNALTSSTSPVPHSRRECGRVAAGPSSASGPRCNGHSTRSPAPPRTRATTGSTSWPPTSSGVRCSPSCTPHRRGRSTAPGSCSSTRAPRRSTTTGSVAGECVAILRWAAGRDPHDRDLSDLVGELATHSEAFRNRWAAHDVRFHNTGVKQLHHPVVGELTLSFNRLDLPADHGLTIFTYTAEPGSRSEEALKLLGSWAATADPAESAHATDQS